MAYVPGYEHALQQVAPVFFLVQHHMRAVAGSERGPVAGSELADLWQGSERGLAVKTNLNLVHAVGDI